MNDRTIAAQVYRVYIRSTAQRYGYGGRSELDLRPGGAYRGLASEEMKQAGGARGVQVPDVAVDGTVVDADPPRKLTLSFRMLMDPALAAEGFTRLTYEIEELRDGVAKLTVTHELENAPKLAALLSGTWEGEGAGGGWSWVLSELKTLLETGKPFPR